jgi:hypothetical protein
VGGDVAVIVLRAGDRDLAAARVGDRDPAGDRSNPPPSSVDLMAVEICLRPCTWDGPGLLGCHLTPL